MRPAVPATECSCEPKLWVERQAVETHRAQNITLKKLPRHEFFLVIIARVQYANGLLIDFNSDVEDRILDTTPLALGRQQT